MPLTLHNPELASLPGDKSDDYGIKRWHRAWLARERAWLARRTAELAGREPVAVSDSVPFDGRATR